MIFDLDGTLWDATGMAAKIWNETFERRRLPLRMSAKDVKRQMGKTMEEIGRSFFPDLTEAQRRDIMEELSLQEVARMREGGGLLFEGVPDVLRVLSARYRLFIVSNCQAGYVQEFIRIYGFQKYIADFEESGRTGLSKAENIRLIMNRNGIESAVYVGDTKGDEGAARAAGIPFIYASYGFGLATEAEAAIDDIRKLPETIFQLEKVTAQSTTKH